MVLLWNLKLHLELPGAQWCTYKFEVPRLGCGPSSEHDGWFLKAFMHAPLAKMEQLQISRKPSESIVSASSVLTSSSPAMQTNFKYHQQLVYHS